MLFRISLSRYLDDTSFRKGGAPGVWVLKFPLPLLHNLQTRRGTDNFSAQWLGARAVQNPLVSSIQTLVDALLATSVGAVPKRVAI